MEKTIKQFAEELGVTKQTIQYHLRSLPTKHVTKNDKGIILIKPSGQGILSKKISSKTDKENSKENDKETPNEVEFLRNELAIKNEQIKEFQNSQKQLQKLLDQQQILTLQANKKIEQLELQVSAEDENKDQPNSEDVPEKNNSEVIKETPKKSFLNRLFNK